LVLKFRLDRIDTFGFGDIATFMSSGFGLKLTYLRGCIRRACAESKVNLLPG